MFSTPAKRKHLLHTIPATDVAKKLLLTPTPASASTSTPLRSLARNGRRVLLTPRTPTPAKRTISHATPATPSTATRARGLTTPSASSTLKLLAQHASVLKRYYESSKVVVTASNARRDLLRNAKLLQKYRENNEAETVQQSIRQWRRVTQIAIERLVEMCRANQSIQYLREQMAQQLSRDPQTHSMNGADSNTSQTHELDLDLKQDDEEEVENDVDHFGDIYIVCKGMGVELDHLHYDNDNDCFMDEDVDEKEDREEDEEEEDDEEHHEDDHKDDDDQKVNEDQEETYEGTHKDEKNDKDSDALIK